MRLNTGFPEIIVCTLSWGTIGVLVRNVEASSPVITFFRLSFGVVVVLAWLGMLGRLRSLRPGARRGLLGASGLVLAGHWALQFEAFKRLEVAAAILIVFLGPVLMAALAPVVLRERLHAVSIAALALAFGGIALITVPQVGEIDPAGVAAALGSAVLFAALVLMGKLLTAHYEPPVIVAWQLGLASVVMAPVLIGTSTAALGRDLPELALLGAVLTGALGIVFFHAVRALQAQQISVLFYLEPASAVFYAWWALAERPSATTVLGGALIVVAGLVIIRADRSVTAPAGLPDVVVGAGDER